jgi:hypothetical protein
VRRGEIEASLMELSEAQRQALQAAAWAISGFLEERCHQMELPTTGGRRERTETALGAKSLSERTRKVLPETNVQERLRVGQGAFSGMAVCARNPVRASIRPGRPSWESSQPEKAKRHRNP